MTKGRLLETFDYATTMAIKATGFFAILASISGSTIFVAWQWALVLTGLFFITRLLFGAPNATTT